jgi:SNF2 family DNA or RNA helicase
MVATVDIDGPRLKVEFGYNPIAIDAIKQISGRKFVPKDRGGPHWTIPANMRNARRLRDIFGEQLRLTDEAKAWGRNARNAEEKLLSVAGADDAQLERLPTLAPDLFGLVSTRTYQRADISFLAQTSALNANQPGLGKTVETLGGIIEAGMLDGPHLVIAPLTSLDTVWSYELRRFQPHVVLVAGGADRHTSLRIAADSYKNGIPFWLVTNFDTLRGKDGEWLTEVDWTSVTIDEFHKAGLSNSKTKFSTRAFKLKAKRRYCLSGTPVGGKPIKLWSALHFLDPHSFSNKWNWAKEWLVTSNNGFGWDIRGIQEGKEDAFYQTLRPYMVRRTKDEVAPDLPPKTYVDVWCDMTKKQAKFYDAMATRYEIQIDEEHLSATNILALYTRLKQFADARCDIIAGNVAPTTDSGKLPALLDRLAERGIDPDDPTGDAQAVVASQFKSVANMVARYLEECGIPVVLISGDVKPKDRTEIVRSFQEKDGPRVMVIVTTAGGVAITLDQADSIHILDETWTPDDQEQLEDRIHRVSRVHNVTVYKYRSNNSIEQYIAGVNFDKAMINRNILELRRKGIIHG